MIQAILLAGGQGKRMQPYTTVIPKPLLPVGEMPILEIIIRQLKKKGIEEIAISVGYLGSLIEAYFGDGQKWGVRLHYFFENQPLGTAGPIALVKNLSENFLVMNGDILTTLNYQDLLQDHQQHQSLATIALAKRQAKIDFGVIEVNADQTLKDYTEKPTLDYLVSMGIYGFNRNIMEHIPVNKKYDLPDLMLHLKKINKPVHVYQKDYDWLDVGRPDDYVLASEIISQQASKYLN